MLRTSFKAKVLMAFIAASLVVGGLAITTWNVSHSASMTAGKVAQNHEVLSGLIQIKGNTIQVEWSTQSYRITGDKERLVERDAAIAERELTLERIRQLTMDDPQQRLLWAQLREVINERAAISRQVERLRTTQGLEASTAFVEQAPLVETRERTYRLLREMDANERYLLERKMAELRKARHDTLTVGSLAALALLVLLAATYMLIQRQLQETDASQQALADNIREQNKQLELRVTERTEQLRESQDHLRSVIGNVPAMIAYVNAQQRYVYVNRQYRERFAPDRSDITGCAVQEILGVDRYTIAAPMIAKALQGQPQGYDWQPFPGVWQVINYVPKRDAHDQVTGYYVLGTDITERKQAEEDIRALNARMAANVRDLENVSRALKTLSAGNHTMLRSTSEQELLDGMCRAIVEVGGYHIASVWYRQYDEAKSLEPMAECGHLGGLPALKKLKNTWADNPYGRGANATAIRTGLTTVVQDIASDPNYAVWRPSLTGYAAVVSCPLRIGSEVIGTLAVYSAEREIFGSEEVALLSESAEDLAFGIATLRDRVEQRKVQEAMYQLTRFDPLTGLPNEAQFSESLLGTIDRSRQLDQPFAAIQINVERLNEINDALGFDHGDQILRSIGVRLLASAPENTMVARLRSNEFAILLPGGDTPLSITVAQRIEQALTLAFPIADIAIDVSATIGIALFPQHGPTPHDMFRHMDIAVQQARKSGQGHAVFDPSRNRGQSQRLGVAGELRRAIENGDLLLHLQPKIEICTGRVCGSEALVRWKHVERGLIPPVEFIGVAEHTGLIKPLTEWVIETALRLIRTWEREHRELPIAVNLSARNLRDEDLLKKIRRLIIKSGVAPGLLEIEITESMVMEDAEFALRVLSSLRDEGIPLYIDDFGTGYSSLSYLQKLPVEYIKIDQSFVQDMSRSKDSTVIVRSTIDLAHDLGRKVVAEGVETQADWNQLASFGCDIAQGYFIAKPMPIDDFPLWVQNFQPPPTQVPH